MKSPAVRMQHVALVLVWSLTPSALCHASTLKFGVFACPQKVLLSSSDLGTAVLNHRLPSCTLIPKGSNVEVLSEDDDGTFLRTDGRRMFTPDPLILE